MSYVALSKRTKLFSLSRTFPLDHFCWLEGKVLWIKYIDWKFFFYTKYLCKNRDLQSVIRVKKSCEILLMSVHSSIKNLWNDFIIRIYFLQGWWKENNKCRYMIFFTFCSELIHSLKCHQIDPIIKWYIIPVYKTEING